MAEERRRRQGARQGALPPRRLPRRRPPPRRSRREGCGRQGRRCQGCCRDGRRRRRKAAPSRSAAKPAPRGAKAPAAEAGRKAARRAVRRCSRCTTCVPPPVPRRPRPASVVVRAPRARPPVVAPRARRPATRCGSASRAADLNRCHARARSCAASRTRSGSSTRSSTSSKLAELYPKGGDVTIGDLVAKGAVRKNEKVKVLGTGDIAVKLNVAVDKVSELRRAEDRRRRRFRQVDRVGRSERWSSGPVRVLRARTRAAAGTEHPPLDGSGGLVFSAFARIFRTPDLRRRSLFTLGDHRDLPARLVHPRAVRRLPERPGLSREQRADTGGLYDLVNLFSGGALLQLSVFALGIMPYITAIDHRAAAARGHPSLRAPSTRRASPASPS